MSHLYSRSIGPSYSSKAIKYASDKKLPISLIEKCLGENIDSTKVSIDTLATDWIKGIETLIGKNLKSNSYTPS